MTSRRRTYAGVSSRPLDGKTILITGAAGLLGREHVHAVIAAGGKAIAVDVNATGLVDLEREVGTSGKSKLEFHVCDVSGDQEVAALSTAIRARRGGLHGLVINAATNPRVEEGSRSFVRFEESGIGDWQRQLDVGLTGAMLSAKYFGGLMAGSKNGGSVVFVLSMFASLAPDHRHYNPPTGEHEDRVKPLAYSVVKHGQLGMMRYLSTYWAREGIRVNGLSPGAIEDTSRSPMPHSIRDSIQSAAPLSRLARPDEFRSALIFLLSDQSSYMTGADLIIDGGRSVW